MNILETSSLTIGYGKKSVQSNLNLSAGEHDLICLTGTNGAGKSTLLRTLAGLQPSLCGSIMINGRNIATLSSQQRSTLFSLVLTDQIDIERLSVHDLVAMGRFPYTNWAGALSKRDEDIVSDALKNVNLLHKADCFINNISDGEKQRAVIAKALAQDTPLVLLDEPTAHLDLPNRIEIMLLLSRLSQSTGKTFILSTHELDLALQMADRIWLMTCNGIQVGFPEDLMLSGCFQSAFGSESFQFDSFDGHCQVNHFMCGAKVSVDTCQGGETHSAWLKRALLRNGIAIDSECECVIHCTKSGYSVNDQSEIFSSIQNLLESINIVNHN